MSCHINRKLRSQRKLAMDESSSILIFPPSTSSKPGKSRFKKQTHIGGENRRVSSLQHLFQFLISCYSSSYKIQSCNRLVKHTSHKAGQSYSGHYLFVNGCVCVNLSRVNMKWWPAIDNRLVHLYNCLALCHGTNKCVLCACKCVWSYRVCLGDYIDSAGNMRGNITMAETINVKAAGKTHTHIIWPLSNHQHLYAYL